MRFLGKIFVFFVSMENSTSMMCHPFLNGKNYTYWKVRVKAFIKSIDEKAWLSILKGWFPPIVATDVTTDDTTITLKSEKTWRKAKNTLANSNFKALNAIFATIDVTQFKLIYACEAAKDTWIIL